MKLYRDAAAFTAYAWENAATAEVISGGFAATKQRQIPNSKF